MDGMLWLALAALCYGDAPTGGRIAPRLVSERVAHDSDDPAIWRHPERPEQSLVLGTDKDEHGSLYAFDLHGRTRAVVEGLVRPNNVDVEYGLALGGAAVDVAVVTERDAGRLRVFRLPELSPVDGGGVELFEGEEERRAMGVGLYKRPSDGAVFAIVSRKGGASGALLWQYRLEDRGDGAVRAIPVRRFGRWSGPEDPARPGEGNEVEAVAVDDALGAVYYAEERVGIHEYRADPDAAGAAEPICTFGGDGFAEDREGISIVDLPGADGEAAGYLLVSDQAAGRFHVFARAPVEIDGRHDHPRLAVVPVTARQSDGSDACSSALGPLFPEGLFVAMSDDRTFHFYALQELLGAIRRAP